MTKEWSLKSKGFNVEEINDKSDANVCKQSVNRVKSFPKGFRVESISNEMNSKSINQTKNNLLKKRSFVIKVNENNIESNICQNPVNSELNEKMDISSDKSSDESYVQNICENHLNNEMSNQSTDQSNSDSNEDSNKNITESVENDVNNSLLSDSKLHHLLPTFYFKPKHYEIIKQHNLKILKGKLTSSEKGILTRNWNKFCHDFNCDEEMKLQLLRFFTYSSRYSKEEKKRVKKFMKTNNFSLRLAKDLPNRSIFNIYQTARNMFCPLKMPHFSDESFKQKVWSLRFQQKLSYNEIANQVNCNPENLKSLIHITYNDRGEPYDRKNWSSDQYNRFLDAMKVVLNTDDLTQHIYDKNIPYKTIRDLAQINRSETDCRVYWKHTFRWKVVQLKVGQMAHNWSKKDSSRLIYFLWKFDFKNESNIDWDFIKQKFSNICPLNDLMSNWRLIKLTVPHYDTKPYKEIVDYLYDKFLPTVVKTIEDYKQLEDFCTDPPFDDI